MKFGVIVGFLLCAIDLCVSFVQYHNALITIALLYTFQFGIVILPALFLLLKIVWALQGLLWFHTNFRMIYTSSMKNVIGILIGIELNLYIAFGSMGI